MAGIVGASRALNDAWQRPWSHRFLDSVWNLAPKRRLYPGINTPTNTSRHTSRAVTPFSSQTSLRTGADVHDDYEPTMEERRRSSKVTLFANGIQTMEWDSKKAENEWGMDLQYDLIKKTFSFKDQRMDDSTPFRERIREYIRRALIYKDIFTGEFQEHQRGEAIHPMSPLRTTWDVLMLVLILVLCVVAPFRIGFDIQSNTFLDVFDSTCDLLLTTDIVLNFFTGFIEKNETHLEIRKVSLQYLKFWFWADMISTLPVTQMTRLGLLPRNQFMLTLKLLRMIRVFRMLKVARLMNRLKWWVMIRFSVRSIIKFLLIILMVAHWNTCLWCLMSRWGNEGETWAGAIGITVETTVWPKLYLVCFYWAITTMTTIGYGDIQPITDKEKLLTLLVMCTGSCCYAYGITQIVTIVSNLNMADVYYHAQVDNLHEYIERRGLPKSLSHRILEFYDFKRHHSGVFFNEREILKDLPHSLRAEVVVHISEDISQKVSKIPLFSGIEPRFMDNIMVRMKYIPYPPSETVVMEGEVGTRMYFINKGMLQVSVKGCVVATLKSGCFFGEVALYHNKGRRTATVETLTYCEICSLQRKDVEEALGTYPVIMSLIRDRAKTLWAKHNAENSQKLTKSVSQQQKEVRLSMVPHKTSTTAITADIHRELHGEDQNHLDDFQEESDETFLSKMEGLDAKLEYILGSITGHNG